MELLTFHLLSNLICKSFRRRWKDGGCFYVNCRTPFVFLADFIRLTNLALDIVYILIYSDSFSFLTCLMFPIVFAHILGFFIVFNPSLQEHIKSCGAAEKLFSRKNFRCSFKWQQAVPVLLKHLTMSRNTVGFFLSLFFLCNNLLLQNSSLCTKDLLNF